MRNLTNSAIEVVVNTLSGGDAVKIENQTINVDINKAPLTNTTASNDQYLLSDVNNNIKKILYSDLIGSSGSGLTAGEALAITGSQIDLDISKQTAVSSSVDTDIYVLEQADGSIKKITRANLLAGFINTNWTLNSGVLYPLATATNVAIGTTTMNSSEKLRVNGDTQLDGKLSINGSNVLEATALTGSYNFNIQNTNVSNTGTLNLMGVNSGGATNMLTIRNDTTLPKMTFPSGIWTNNFSTNITDTEFSYLDGVSSNIQTQLNSLSNSVSTNTTNISTNQNSITSLTSSVSTITSDLSSLTGQQNSNTNSINVNSGNISTNTGAISSLQGQQNTNTLNISSLTSQQSTNTSNLSINSTAISDIKTKYDFTGSVANGKMLIGSGSNYSVGELLSSDNSVTITKSAGGIDLVVPSSSSLSAGTGINITNSFINYDIQKETAYSSPASADTMLLFDTTNSLTKKITFQNFNAGLQAQITNNDSDITSLNSSVTSLTTQQTSNTNNLNLNSTAITNLTSTVNSNSTSITNLTSTVNSNSSNISTNSTEINNIKTKYDFSTTVLDGKLLIGSTSTGNYSSALLTSTGGTVTITNGSNSINLETSGSSLSAGVAIAINTSNIDLDINKPNAFTSPVSADLLLMYDTTNSLTKKITFSNFNAGLQSQITSNDSDISSLNSSVTSLNSSVSSLTTQQNSNSSAIATNAAAIANIASPASASNLGTASSSAITVGNNSQTLALNSASMNAISAGKHFFRSSLTSGLGFEVQGYNSGGPAYHSVLQVNNVSSGYPYLSFLLGSGFQTSQLASKNIVIDANGRLDVANLSQSLTGGTGITLNSSAIDIDFSGLATATQMFSNNQFMIYSDSDTTYKHITFQNVLNSIDLSPAFNFGTASSFTVNIGHANSQILNLQGTSINLNGSGVITNRSTVANGVGFKLDGYNSADTAYHTVLSLDNTNVSGQKPNLKIMDVNGNVNTASKTLTTDANGKLLWSTSAQTLGGGIGISIDSTPDINIDFTTIATATQIFSNNQFIIYSDSDSLYKNITFQNVLNSIDLSPAFNFGTASSFPVNIGHANNQTLTLQGSLINLTGSNTITNRSSVSTGVSFKVDGYNSADSIYYSTLSVDNTSVAGEKPNLKIMDGAGFTNTASKTLTTDANGKLLWATPSSGGIPQSYTTTVGSDYPMLLLGDLAVNTLTWVNTPNSSAIFAMSDGATFNGSFNQNFLWMGDAPNRTINMGDFNTSIVLGRSAFYGQLDQTTDRIVSTVAIGHTVGQYSGSNEEAVLIGTIAGRLSFSNNQSVYIGYNSRSNSFGSTYSNVCCLGSNAESTASNQAIVGSSSTNSFRIYGSWSNVSDRRDKYDIVDTVYGLDFINKLRVVDYKYNYRNRYQHFNDETKEHYYETDNKQYAGKRTHTGLISQEVKEILDSENKDHSMFQINNYSDSDTNTDDGQFIVYQETISMCVKAIQELSARVIELEKKIN